MEELPPELEHRRAAIYERVVRRGRALRRRGWMRVATVMAVTVALLGGSLAVAIGRVDQHRRAVTVGPTATSEPTSSVPTTSTQEPTTTAAASTTAPTTDGPPITAAPPATSPPTTPATSPPVTANPDTTTTLVCHNSYNPACGPLVYDPPFTNAPATVMLTQQPAAPVVGDTVTFTMHITDPDSGKYASVPGCYPNGAFGDGASSKLPVCPADCAAPTPRHGVWDAPKTEPADLTYTFKHAYTNAGEYTADFSLQLGQCEPWSSFAHKTTKVVIAPS